MKIFWLIAIVAVAVWLKSNYSECACGCGCTAKGAKEGFQPVDPSSKVYKVFPFLQSLAAAVTNRDDQLDMIQDSKGDNFYGIGRSRSGTPRTKDQEREAAAAMLRKSASMIVAASKDDPSKYVIMTNDEALKNAQAGSAMYTGPIMVVEPITKATLLSQSLNQFVANTTQFDGVTTQIMMGSGIFLLQYADGTVKMTGSFASM